MELLTPGMVKRQQASGEAETQRRIIALREEEVRATQACNNARQIEQEEKARIKRELEELKTPLLEAKRTVLYAEVAGLEDRKRKALEPIDELRNEVDGERAAAHVAMDRAAKSQEDANALLASAQERIAQAELKEAAANERETSLNFREKTIAEAEKILEQKAKDSAVKTADTDAVCEEKKKALDMREGGLVIREDFIKTLTLEQNKREEELNNKNIQILDRYQQLQKTELEISQKHGG